jgi:hypothetical protein
MKYMAEKVAWEPRPTPLWWSPAWEELADVREANDVRIPSISHCEFKEHMTEDVFMLDEVVLELGVDADTGEQVDSSSNPELVSVAVGVV